MPLHRLYVPRRASPWNLNEARAYPDRMIGDAPRAAAGDLTVEDLLWLGIVAGLALLTFAYAALCDKA